MALARPLRYRRRRDAPRARSHHRCCTHDPRLCVRAWSPAYHRCDGRDHDIAVARAARGGRARCATGSERRTRHPALACARPRRRALRGVDLRARPGRPVARPPRAQRRRPAPALHPRARRRPPAPALPRARARPGRHARGGQHHGSRASMCLFGHVPSVILRSDAAPDRADQRRAMVPRREGLRRRRARPRPAAARARRGPPARLRLGARRPRHAHPRGPARPAGPRGPATRGQPPRVLDPSPRRAFRLRGLATRGRLAAARLPAP